MDAVKESSEQKQRSGSSLPPPLNYIRRGFGGAAEPDTRRIRVCCTLFAFKYLHRSSQESAESHDADGSESPRDGGGGEDQRRRLVPAAGRDVSDTPCDVFRLTERPKMSVHDEYEKNTHFFECFLNPAVLPTSSAHDVSLGVFLKSVNY